MLQTPLLSKIRDAALRVVLARDVTRIRYSGLFDPEHYLVSNPDIRASTDPALHYMTVGGKELLDPSPGLQARRLLTQVPRFRVGIDNPVIFLEDHYIARGRVLPDLGTPPPLQIRALLDNLQPEDHPAEDIGLQAVDIIVPVHNNAEKLAPLLHALMAHTKEQHTVVLIDDGSAQEDVPRLLAEFSRNRSNVEIITNQTNLGYAASVNQGLRHSSRHKILLNSDTIVPAGWVDRLIEPILCDPKIASVTPYSNASTYSGFPENRIELAISDPSVVASMNESLTLFSAQNCELVCGVGFCMAINSRAIEVIGYLDDAAFQQGYYEDTEWCYRARRNGFRNVLANRLFVGHDHLSSSFGNSRKLAALKKSEVHMREKYPGYFDDMDAFYLADPHRDLRRQCELVATCRNHGDLITVFETDQTTAFAQTATDGACVLRISPDTTRVAIEGRHFAAEAVGSNLEELFALMELLGVKRIVADTPPSSNNAGKLHKFAEAQGYEIRTPDTVASAPAFSPAAKQTPPCIGIIAPAPGQAGWDRVDALIAQTPETATKCSILLFGNLPGTQIPSPAISQTGIYRLENIPALIRHHDVDVIYFPSTSSHIFACTYRELLAMGLAIVTHGGGRAEALSGIYDNWTIAPDQPAARILAILEARACRAGPAISSPV